LAAGLEGRANLQGVGQAQSMARPKGRGLNCGRSINTPHIQAFLVPEYTDVHGLSRLVGQSERTHQHFAERDDGRDTAAAAIHESLEYGRNHRVVTRVSFDEVDDWRRIQTQTGDATQGVVYLHFSRRSSSRRSRSSRSSHSRRSSFTNSWASLPSQLAWAIPWYFITLRCRLSTGGTASATRFCAMRASSWSCWSAGSSRT